MVFIYDMIYLDNIKDLKEKNLFLKYPLYSLEVTIQHKKKLSEGVYSAERTWHLQ